MLSAAGSALVAGNFTENEMDKAQTRRVKVLRAFYMDGKPTKVGDVLDVSVFFAAELKGGNKVEFVEDKAEKTVKKGEAHAR